MKLKVRDINFKKLKQIGKSTICTIAIGATAFSMTGCGMSKQYKEYIMNANTNPVVDYKDGCYEMSGAATNDDLKIIPSYVRELLDEFKVKYNMKILSSIA